MQIEYEDEDDEENFGGDILVFGGSDPNAKAKKIKLVPVEKKPLPRIKRCIRQPDEIELDEDERLRLACNHDLTQSILSFAQRSASVKLSSSPPGKESGIVIEPTREERWRR